MGCRVIIQHIAGRSITIIARAALTSCAGSYSAGVVTAAIGGIVGGGLCAQVDLIDGASGVILGFGENLHHIVVRRQHRVRGIIAAGHLQAIFSNHQCLGIIAVICQRVGIYYLSIDRKAGEVGRVADGEALICQNKLSFCQTYAILAVSSSRASFFVSEVHSQLHCRNRIKRIDNFIDWCGCFRNLFWVTSLYRKILPTVFICT